MSSSIPCYEAYVLASISVSFGTVSAILAFSAFIMYAYTLHRYPNAKFPNNTKYDIESASWVLVLTSIGGLATSTALILNYNCGASCSATTISCNTSIGTYAGTMIATFSAMCAAIMKNISVIYQIRNNNVIPPKNDINSIEITKNNNIV